MDTIFSCWITSAFWEGRNGEIDLVQSMNQYSKEYIKHGFHLGSSSKASFYMSETFLNSYNESQ